MVIEGLVFTPSATSSATPFVAIYSDVIGFGEIQSDSRDASFIFYPESVALALPAAFYSNISRPASVDAPR